MSCVVLGKTPRGRSSAGEHMTEAHGVRGSTPFVPILLFYYARAVAACNILYAQNRLRSVFR